ATWPRAGASCGDRFTNVDPTVEFGEDEPHNLSSHDPSGTWLLGGIHVDDKRKRAGYFCPRRDRPVEKTPAICGAFSETSLLSSDLAESPASCAARRLPVAWISSARLDYSRVKETSEIPALRHLV